MSKGCPDSCILLQNNIKDILTPFILTLIKEVNRILYKDGNEFLLVVSGGEALYRFFPKDYALRSHDFDLKLAPVIKDSKNKKINTEKQHIISATIIDFFEKGLNEYIISILPELSTNIVKNLVFDEDGNLFSAKKHINRSGNIIQVPAYKYTPVKNTLDLYVLMYTTKVSKNKGYEDSLVDIFIASPASSKSKKNKRIHYYDHINDANKSDPQIYIPYIYIEGVPYASLGYLIWDTLRMIKDTKNVKNSKYDRYQMKFEHIIENLYNPSNTLDCTAMKGFVNSCSRDMNKYNDGCRVGKGNKKYNKSELLNYAVDNGYIPSFAKPIFEKELSKNYLCDYINTL